MSEARDIERLFDGEDAVDVRPIELIHRGHNGGVAFARKRNGKFEQLWALPANGIAGIFRDVVGEIEQDGFFSINGFRRAVSPSPFNPKLPRAERRSSWVRWLTCCFADLDCYRWGSSFGSTVGRILDLQDEGKIPAASMIVRSGQGAWPLWLLADAPGGRKPVQAWPEAIECWHRIQGELHRTLVRHMLPPDTNARDLARVMRVPGSINGKCGVRVRFVPFLDERGEPIVYGLDELASLVGVRPSKKKRLPSDRPVDPARRERGLKGKRELARKRLAWILGLAELRGGFAEGVRHQAALLFAKFRWESCTDVDGMRVDPAGAGEVLDIRRSVAEFVRDHCAKGTHPVVTAEVLAGDRFAKLRWTDVLLIERLGITDTEAKAIGCPTLDEARNRQERRDKDANREERGRQRRELIAHFVNRSLGQIPTLEAVQAMLAEVGIEVTKPTIGRDWDHLHGDGRLPKRRMKPGKLVADPIIPELVLQRAPGS